MSSSTTAAHGKPIASLRIQVIECKGLTASEKGKSDPYVVVKYAGCDKQTPKIDKTLNPVYEPATATFDFPIYANALDAARSKIEFIVWDKDVDNDDDYLGEISILSGDWFEHCGDKGFANAGNKDFWLSLLSTQPNRKPKGQIRLKLGFVDTTDPERVWNQLFGKAANGVLRIQVLGCKELYASEHGKSDPYVTLKFADKDHKTPYIKKTLQPVYDPATATFDFDFDGSVLERVGSNVELVVFDKDEKGEDDRLGQLTLPLVDLIGHSGDRDFTKPENKDFWLALDTSKAGRKPKGQVNLKVGFVNTDIPRLWKELFEKLSATLRVQVLACKQLPHSDVNGKSDPYVVVEFLGAVLRTPVIPNNLNPVYDPKTATIDFQIRDSDVAKVKSLAEAVKIVVWDKDPGNKSDYLGELTLPVTEWFKHNGGDKCFSSEGNKDFWLPLVSTRVSRKAKGQIHLKLGFVDETHGNNTDFGKLYTDLFGSV